MDQNECLALGILGVIFVAVSIKILSLHIYYSGLYATTSTSTKISTKKSLIIADLAGGS